MSTRVLIAFDKFKDALTAERACAICARAVARVHPNWEVETAPLTDGGEGFCNILTEQAGGRVQHVPASGPRLERIEAPLGILEVSQLPEPVRQMLFSHLPTLPRRVAVVEMAAVSGLALLAPEARDPWKTTSLGTGQLLRAAAEMGADFAILGIGGSATSDLGLGALAALGLEFRTDDGSKIRPPFPETWERITAIDGEVFPATPRIAIACDVSNPLLGPNGAAAIYGPQKGLKPEDLPRHEAQAERLARLLCEHQGVNADEAMVVPGTGAAGGISFGLMVTTGATLVPGFDLVNAWLDLDRRLDRADIVITGEGRFDESSLSGKGPGTILDSARKARKKAIVFAGAVSEALQGRDDIHAITPEGMPLEQALATAGENLAEAVARHLA